LKWFKAFFQKERFQNNQKTIPLTNLASWLDEKSNSHEFENSLMNICNPIKEIRDDLVKDSRDLGSAVPDETTPTRLLRAGLAARFEVIKQIDSLEKNLSLPNHMDLDAVSSYQWTLVKSLERTVKNYGKAQMYMAALFPRESEALNSDLNRLGRLLVALEEELRKMRKEQEEVWFSRELVSKVMTELFEINELHRRINKDEETLIQLQNSTSKLEMQLKNFEASEEGKRAEDLKKELDISRDELKTLDKEMMNLVAPLAKALTRIVKQGSSERLTLHHRDVLELLSQSPSKALDTDVNEAIRELRSNLATLGLKDRKKEKTIAHIDFLIKNRPLERLKARQNIVQENIEDLEKRLSNSCSEFDFFRKDLNQTRTEIKYIEVELNQNRKTLVLLEERALADKVELRSRIGKIADEPIEIDFVRGE
jgi:chromosome segregation ATPase